ncbi:XRE family transcriptional regulator [Salmonella enterica]|nr:XRE family transcriptional regulator [Salmonella enterica]
MEKIPSNVKKLRIDAGLTQQECADIFGLTINNWQKKEYGAVKTSNAEFNYLLLLAGEHPDYILTKRNEN